MVQKWGLQDCLKLKDLAYENGIIDAGAIPILPEPTDCHM